MAYSCIVDKPFTMTLHAGLANYISLPNFMDSNGSVGKFNLKKKKTKKKMKNFDF